MADTHSVVHCFPLLFNSVHSTQQTETVNTM